MTKAVAERRAARRVIGILTLDFPAQNVTVYPPSIVDSSQYESLAVMVEKFQRGEPILSSSRVDAVQLTDQNVDPEAVLADMSVMRESGADIVDASAALRRGEEAKVQLREAKKAKDAKEKAEKDAKDKSDREELEKLRAARAAKRDATEGENPSAQ